MTGDPSHFNAVLSRLKRVKSRRWGWTACCPAHDDTHQSLSVRIGRTGALAVKCHANSGCTFDAIVFALGLEKTEFFPVDERKERMARKIEETYDYRGVDGKLRYQVVRFTPKGFAQRRPVLDANGQPAWEWGLGDLKPLIYKLPELLANEAKRTVFIVEGEKDVETLGTHKFLATCNSGGSGKWPTGFEELFRGCPVVVIADNDGPGLAHAVDIASKLLPVASSLKLLERMPAVPAKGDVSWWFAKGGGTRQGLIELVKATPNWQPPGKETVAGQDSSVSKEAENGQASSNVSQLVEQAKQLGPPDLFQLLRELIAVAEQRGIGRGAGATS